MLRGKLLVVLLISVLGFGSALSAQQKLTREEKVRADRKKVEAEGFWIYNNLDAAFAKAKETGKPLLVVLRCIPCEECVKLDDELLEQDPVVRPLLDKFVCARQVSTNGLDLSLFQFDTDQSFAVFLLNADKTIYGRFGTRSHRTEWVGDVSLKGLAAALQGALDLHAEYPRNREALAAKRGPQPEFRSPEDYPKLKATNKYKSTLNYAGNVSEGCIHCHQIGDAQRDLLRSSGKTLSESVLFPYPNPKAIGLILDPDQKATVKDVLAGSPAAEAGFKAGDIIERINGQPPLSIADVQWVLQQTGPEGGTVTAKVQRSGASQDVNLRLGRGWRKHDEIAWRSSSWGMRRMATGGMLLEPATAEERKAADVPEGAMALRAKHVGEYGEHAAAKKAGFVKGDLIIGFDGRTDLVREADLFHYALTQRKVGDQVPVIVWRDGKKQTFQLPLQN